MKRLFVVGRSGLYCLIVTGSLALLTDARSEEKIGIAVTVRNEVTGVLSSRTLPINVGEDVFGKEIVKTGLESSAKLVFVDSTNLAVAPNSSVTLDKFVYAGPSDYKKATLTLVRGAFRFTTGSSDKRAYEIKTGVASIGVRGTDFTAVSSQNKSIVTVHDGAVLGCTLSTYRCTVVHKGETAIFTLTSVANEGSNSPKAVEVDPITPKMSFAQASELTQVAELTAPSAAAWAVGGAAVAAGAGGLAAGLSNQGNSNQQDRSNEFATALVLLARPVSVSP